MKKRHPLLLGMGVVRPYPTVTAATLYDVPAPVMTIEDFLPAGGVMGLTSQPGVGKTWLAMHVCETVGTGKLFLNKFKTIRGGVLFVGADSSIYDYARQWKRLTREQHEADPSQFDSVRFLVQESFLFEDQDEVRRLIRTHQTFEWGDTTHEAGTNLPRRERGFHVIVFDTLSALTNVPESDNTGREQVFRMIRLIAEVTDCAVILLHHNAQRSEFNDGTNFRGGTAQLARLDSHVNIAPSRRDPYLIGVTYKKFRGIRPKDFAYRMNVGDPKTASLEISADPVTREQRMRFNPLSDAICEYVQQHPGATAPAIAKALAPRFEEGVPGPNNTTMRFATLEKMKVGVNNRLPKLLADNRVRRDMNDEGKPTYYVAEQQPDEAGAES